jgi:hypothetical protein
MTNSTSTCPHRPRRWHFQIVLLAILLATGPVEVAAAQPTGPAITATASASDLCLPSRVAAPSQPAQFLVIAQYFGDRQRVVQVALICMAVAILILVRGNRF